MSLDKRIKNTIKLVQELYDDEEFDRWAEDWANGEKSATRALQVMDSIRERGLKNNIAANDWSAAVEVLQAAVKYSNAEEDLARAHTLLKMHRNVLRFMHDRDDQD